MNFKHLLQYLAKLKKNNTKEWFEKNRPEFELLKSGFIEYIGNVIIQLSKIDPDISDTEAKKAIFRMNRDIRFSKDKTPYKENFGAFIKPGGKKSPFAGYYIHLEPGKSFFAGGLYMPEAEVLQKVRETIDYDASELRKFLKSKAFKEYFGELQGDQLKNIPKGYDTDHPSIDLLKHKSFLLMHPLKDELVCAETFASHTDKILKAMVPFNKFFNQAISYEA